MIIMNKYYVCTVPIFITIYFLLLLSTIGNG